MRAHSGALHPAVKEVSCRPSTALPPCAKHSSKDGPVLFLSPSGPQTRPPCKGPTDSPPPSSSPNRCPSPRGWGGASGRGQRTRGHAASEEGRVCSPSAAAHPGDSERHGFLFTRQQLSAEKRSTGATNEPGTWTHRRSTAVPPFLRSTPGGAGPGLRFKPRTAPSLLVCSWHSLPSHWRLPVPPRMRFLGDPAETFESGRGQPLAPRQLCCHLERRAGGARPTCGGELVRRGS